MRARRKNGSVGAFGRGMVDLGPVAPEFFPAGPTTDLAPVSSNTDVFTAARIVPPPLFPSQKVAVQQVDYSFPQTLVSSPDPQSVVVAAPPQKIVVTLPTVEQRAYAPPAETPPIYEPPAPTYANDGPRPTTETMPPTFEPGGPSLRPMGLKPVDPATGQATASTDTGIAAPPEASPQSTNGSTLALIAGGLGLVAGIWFFTRT